MNSGYLAGLKREIHHVKKAGDDDGYEPAMIITRERIKGKSFIIPLSAFWKYVEPKMTQDAFQADMKDYVDRVRSIKFRLALDISDYGRHQAEQELACAAFAEAFSRGTEILLSVSFNLAKCMQMMEINPKGHLPQAAAQLLMWIQDGLEDLKNYREPEPDRKIVVGEVTVWDGSHKIASKDMEMTETELVEERNE